VSSGRDACNTLAMARGSRTANIGRLGEIAQVAVRHGFGSFLEERRSGGGAAMSSAIRGRHLREMLDELGPTFVKFGQLLSTRPDIVPPDWIAELRGLQDDVRPFPFADVERVVAEELKQPLERLFLEFDQEPVAAASIGQVHRAVLPNGRRVAVKVQRPNAPRQIESDIQLLEQAARLVKERVRALDFVDTREVVDEFARSIRQELDYRQEGRNAQAFHRNFAAHPHVTVPRTYWSYTSQRVLTLEYLDGVQLADLDVTAWTMDQRKDLAYVIAEAWLTMIFRHGFFHGDPHPANILVLSPGRIGLVDFGLAGKLTDRDLSRLTRLFIDAAHENVEVLPRRLADLGVRYPKEKEEQFVSELHAVYSRYYGSSLSEIDPLQVIREAFALIYSMNLRLPSRFVMLDKAIATIGSVGAELYPDFNVFEVARPYARSLMLERFTPQRMASRARRESVQLAQVASSMPYQVHETLEQLRSGEIEFGFVHKGLDELLHKLDVLANRLVIALVTTGGLIGSSLIGIFAKSGPHLLGLNVVSAIGFVLSGVLGVWLLWGVVRSGRI
jgi:ubiquinone biosynthesis protein